MKNRYIHRAKITEKKFKQMLQLFCLDLNASQIAGITGINRNTVNRYLTGIRGRIARHCRCQGDSYFCCHAFAEENAGNKNGSETFFLGIAKDNGNIRSRIIPEDIGYRLHPHLEVMKKEEEPVSIAAFKDVSGLIDLQRMRYIKIGSGEKGIDICDGFWGFVRSRLQHFRGLKKSTLLLHIMECEFRYNHGREEIYVFLLNQFSEAPLFQ